MQFVNRHLGLDMLYLYQDKGKAIARAESLKAKNNIPVRRNPQRGEQ